MAVNARLLAYNFIKYVECTTAQATFPATNLLNDERWKYLITTGVPVHVIDFHYVDHVGRTRAVALNHKLRAYDTIKIELFNGVTNDPANLVYSNTETFVESMKDTGWHYSELAGDHLLEDRQDTEKLYIHYPGDVQATGGKLTITQLGNLQLSANSLFSGDYFTTQKNVSSSPGSGYDDLTSHSINLDGDVFTSPEPMYQYLDIDWPLLTEHERQRLAIISRAFGRRKKIIASLHPDSGDYKEVLDQIWGHFEEVPFPVRRAGMTADYYTASARIKAPYVSS